ncbi:ArsA-related P-loop ATPase [Nannocystis sp.]|uniref:ArsA family ATPase n=1 Tax=Nannocystis sp. TaxID=1962667 RepID=UPI0025DC112F|nr:ArsA-related P-loop ATPase [Nannocystis sp.]MBK7824727.1 AAA family ATPase [Nannocystis sp.]
MSLDDLLHRKSLLVCVGPGGVGKTTVAAALALQAARAGRRTLVLTIDPARRLAAMLGLDGLDDAVRPVPVETLPGARGHLDAAMLDTRASYDALIHRIASDPEHRQRILDNRLYRVMSRSFGAAHAYVAMERLHDVLGAGYDLVVLDTPPTRNALDILDAPNRLATFLEEGVVKWFVRDPGVGLRGRLLARGGAAATRLLGKIAGDALVQELGEFFAVFMSLREGFQQRAEQVQRSLRADSSAFVLVSSAMSSNLADAQFLHDGLVARGIRVQATVFNRAYVQLGDDPDQVVTTATPRALAHAAGRYPDGDPRRRLLAQLDVLRAAAAAENLVAAQAVAQFAGQLDPTCLKVQVPSFARELRDLPALAQLGDRLCAAVHAG